MRPGERTLRRLAEPIYRLLDEPGVTDLFIQRPGEAGVKKRGITTWHAVPELTYRKLDAISVLAAEMTSQTVGTATPRCSTILPSDGRIDYRVQIARPPLVATGTIAMSIRRRASDFVPTLEWLSDTGYFAALDTSVDWPAYWHRKVEARATIVLGGDTGSGKSTFAEALIRAIPLNERIITIEKTAEWCSLPHQNWLAKYYGFAGDGKASERAAVLCVEDSLRDNPNRVLLGEIRSGGESWAYLRALMGGHPGGIATIHAISARGVFDAYGAMISQDEAGATRSAEDIRDLVGRYIHVVAHCAEGPYRVTEVVETDSMSLRQAA